MNKFSLLIIDLLFGLIIGLILICLFSKLKSFFLNLFSLQKHKITPRENLYLMDLSRTWMYELRDKIYNSHEFSFSMTNICLIEIEKNILFVYQPSKEPDHKLNDDELYSKVSFDQVRIYNLNKAIIGLLPINMIRSKYWSKKSPIVLQNILYLRNEFIQKSSSMTNLSISLNKKNENNIQKTLFLFTRTRRSKEDWFYRFVNASQLDLWRKEICYQLEQDETEYNQKQILMTKRLHRKKNMSMVDNDQEHRKHMIGFLERTDRFAAPDRLPYLKSVNVVRKFRSNLKQETRNKNRKQLQRKNYNGEICSLNSYKQQYCERWLREQNQMDMISKDQTTQYNLKKCQANHGRNTNHTKTENQYQHTTHSLLFFVLKYLQKLPHNTIENNIENPILLLNIFATRCFLDIFDHEQYLERINVFLQKQLRKLKIPFVEHITIRNLNLGDRLPEIKDIFKPWIDEHGLWSHMKISYDGKLQLTLTAKIKWIQKNRLIDPISHKRTSVSNPTRKTDFKEEDKEAIIEKYVPIKKSWRKRLWPPTRWFRYRRLTLKTPPSNKTNLKNTNKQENYSLSYLDKVLPKTSKTTIVIKLEVNNLNGILLFNIPPIPSDRIWISFLDMPEMEFSVTPHLGEYRVPFYRIKDKLKRKLHQTFRRYLVMPNMKDFIIPTVNDYLSDSGFIKVISE